jgi:hypothetical protein
VRDHHLLIDWKLFFSTPFAGKREIVGFGQNGSAIYEDIRDYPAPAIRFREDDAEIAALRQKEKGDWNALTIEEKKTRNVELLSIAFVTLS